MLGRLYAGLCHAFLIINDIQKIIFIRSLNVYVTVASMHDYRHSFQNFVQVSECIQL